MMMNDQRTLPVLALRGMIVFPETDTYFEVSRPKSLKALENAIYRSIAHCYATNGYYPNSLAYLQEHYGLHFDTEQYFVDYQIWSENVMPDVTIIPK